MLTRLQILRAFAAYLVVVFHWSRALKTGSGYDTPGTYALACGVDLFFVISGLVMVYVAGDRQGPGRFMFDRIARIVPLYWVALLGVIALRMIRPWIFSEADLSPVSVVSAFLFIPDFNATGHLSPLLGVGWTLNFEMMFYALFALAMFAPVAWRVPVVLVLISMLFTAGALTPDTVAFSFYGDPILFEFGAGCLIGWLVSDPKRLSAMARIPAWLYVLAGVLLFLGNENQFGQPENRLLRWGVPAMFIVAGIVVLDLQRPKASKGVLVWLGDTSYSAYLLHLFVMIAVSILMLPLLPLAIQQSPAFLIMSYPVVITLVALVSAVSYQLIEIPGRNFLRRLLPRKPATAVAAPAE